MKKLSLIFIVVLMATAAILAYAAPKPAIVQKPFQWTLDTRYANPQQISIKLPGEKTKTRFWYTIITLTNNTKSDTDFYPECALATDTFQLIPAGKKVPRIVFEKIKKRHRRKYPFLESLETTENRVLQGIDNARDIAIIWPDFDTKTRSIKLFVAGLSNEIAVVKHPTKVDENQKPVEIYLRKTLELTYNISGDPAYRSRTILKFKSNLL